MNGRTAVLLGIAAGVLGWVTASWVTPLPWAILTVTYVTVAGGRGTGAATAVTAGLMLGAVPGTTGCWVLALVATVPAVDRLHRETLTHRTPATPVLLTAVATGIALPIYWLLAALASALTGSVVNPTVGPAAFALGASLATGIATVVIARIARNLALRIQNRVR